jgi:hypothetical protein
VLWVNNQSLTPDDHLMIAYCPNGLVTKSWEEPRPRRRSLVRMTRKSCQSKTWNVNSLCLQPWLYREYGFKQILHAVYMDPSELLFIRRKGSSISYLYEFYVCAAYCFSWTMFIRSFVRKSASGRMLNKHDVARPNTYIYIYIYSSIRSKLNQQTL